MQQTLFMSRYLLWHYGRGFVSIFRVWGNFLWFFTHLFSIPLLLRTLFVPFRRVEETYHGGGAEDFFSTLTVNIISRIVGFIARSVIVAIGLVALLALSVCFIATLVFWLAAPLVLAVVFFYGVLILFL